MLLEREREREEKNCEAVKKKATLVVIVAQMGEPTTLSGCLSVEGDDFP